MTSTLAGLLVSMAVATAAQNGEKPLPPSIDAPLGALLRDPEARAIVVRDFPRNEEHPQLRQIETLSLRTVVPNSRGWFTRSWTALRRVCRP